jgi:DNA polymerase III subunit delta'
MPLAGIAGNRELIAGLEAEVARRPAHAYLFAGPRGVGKSLVARGLAQSLLCERAPGAAFCCDPAQCLTRAAAAVPSGRTRANAPVTARCECCAGCVQVALGVHPDFLYVARQPNRTDLLIEQVRDLIERLGVRPVRGPRRIAIIDDAETLNLPAQNALLKTLEEPPGYTMIIMVTQSERALIDTVRSRMRPVRFGPLTPAEIAGVLTAYRGVSPDRAGTIAPLVRGSVSLALALAEGDAPPVTAMLDALGRGAELDFAAIQALAQEYFGTRDRAVANFELIARLLEEMLCFKLLVAEIIAPSPAAAHAIAEIAARTEAAVLARIGDAALSAATAVDEMANSRLQAEHFWIAAGRELSKRS